MTGKVKSSPFSIRLTENERALLAKKAGKRTIGAFMREAVLGAAKDARAPRSRVTGDTEALSRLLALLGQSRIANNLNQLAKAANTGSLPLTDEVEADLREACKLVADMRRLLMQALGKQLPDEAPSLVPEFEKAAGQKEPQR